MPQNLEFTLLFNFSVKTLNKSRFEEDLVYIC